MESVGSLQLNLSIFFHNLKEEKRVRFKSPVGGHNFLTEDAQFSILELDSIFSSPF